jgi:hypothetical protein
VAGIAGGPLALIAFLGLLSGGVYWWSSDRREDVDGVTLLLEMERM